MPARQPQQAADVSVEPVWPSEPVETADADPALAPGEPAVPSRDPAMPFPDRVRTQCNVCDTRLAGDRSPDVVRVPCHVRAFVNRPFRLWRCPTCRCLHCLDVVDLDHYYSMYPFKAARLDFVWAIFYINLARRFLRAGLSRGHKLLDYGCANGLFCRALRGRGFKHAVGYDPYQPADGLGDPRILETGPFDYILLQDVIEHVEDPHALLERLDDLLKPGGHILVGTPNADRIDPARPDRYANELHAPYHLHIYTRDALEDFGRRRHWTPVAYYDRSYHDRPWFALNTRAVKHYQHIMDGTFDVLFERFRLFRAMRSPTWWFLALFGYWRSYRSDMAIMFRKPA